MTLFSGQAAVFPPQFRNLDDPKLELFDLDEAFSSEKSRLAQITNKCGEEDLEYYIRYQMRATEFFNPTATIYTMCICFFGLLLLIGFGMIALLFLLQGECRDSWRLF